MDEHVKAIEDRTSFRIGAYTIPQKSAFKDTADQYVMHHNILIIGKLPCTTHVSPTR